MSAPGKPETWAQIERVAAGALRKAAPGSATHLQALLTLYWLNQRLGRRDKNLALVGDALQHHGSVPWLALAFPATADAAAFRAFTRRALLRLCRSKCA